jgi:NADH-quinone oxidoreductase subunit E
VPLSEATRDEISRQKERYPSARSAILPALWAVQHELGYLAPEGMEEVARILDMAPSEVQAVATFYSMYFQRPAGRHTVMVCVNVACALRGADDVVAYLERALGCPSGSTTADGMFTWQSTIECLGACGYAPMMQIDHRFHENLTPAKIDAILDRVAGEAADDGHATTPPTAVPTAPTPVTSPPAEAEGPPSDARMPGMVEGESVPGQTRGRRGRPEGNDL